MQKVIIKIHSLSKIYQMGELQVDAVKKLDLEVCEGEYVAIMGASGSGKSTLMNILGCLDEPTFGTYSLDGIDVSKLKIDDYAEIRNQKLGFIFQTYNLLPRTTALENVELPLIYDRKNNKRNIREAAQIALKKVGLADRMNHLPSQLSGGQQQRVAIARALVNNPAILLADEPTGNLDTKTSYEIMELFTELNKKGITIILVTHELDIAKFTKRNIVLRDGKIVEDTKTKR
ncbi:MAG: ABC transporter ATP-binding protein [Candidatus Cloacimonadota bacterium]|nr:ABC transporter ATP-binding protein [Candidatus Cloacimonadota bacterium]